MYLTTIRVRQCRPDTLDQAITNARRLNALHAQRRTANLIEVLCAGKPVAIVNVGVGDLVWTAPGLTPKGVGEQALIDAVLTLQKLMEACRDADVAHRGDRDQDAA